MAVSIDAAAWVPDNDPKRPWDTAADWAVAWLMDEVEKRGVSPLLVTPTQSQWHCGVASIEALANRYEATTSRSNRASFGNRPVLAYVPDYGDLQLALRYAEGSAIAVVETVSCPIRGWAASVGALDLTSGEPTPPATAKQLDDFDRIAFNGNNGWTRGFGADVTTRILRDMAARSDLDKDLLLGYMVANGHSGKQIARLGELVDQSL